MSIKTYKKIKMIVFYFIIKKNPEISFRNGPEHEATSLRYDYRKFYFVHIFSSQPCWKQKDKRSIYFNLFQSNYLSIYPIYLFINLPFLSFV